MTILAEKFLNYRSTKGLTQIELAKLLNVSRNYVNQIENGKRRGSRVLKQKFELLEKGELE